MRDEVELCGDLKIHVRVGQTRTPM
ncbi:hypothetical protein AKJ16_DCAP21103, partial [Drosera capensis]